MQTEAQRQAAYLAAGLPAPTPVPASPSTINSDNTKPTSPIPYTTPQPVPTYPVGSLDTTIPTPVAAPTPAETQANDLTASLKALNESIVGKSAYQVEQNTAAGVDTAQKTVTDLSAQLVGLQNEAKAIPIQLQSDAAGRGITAGGLAPIQSAQVRDNAVKALTLSTILEAAKGNLSNAQAIADKAVAQKYGPIQEQITAATANLNLIINSPEYTLEQKNRAQAQLDIQNKRQDALDKAKDDAKLTSTVAITAAQNTATFKPTVNYPSVSTALTAIANAKTPAEATRIATEAGLVKPVDLQTQTVEVNGRKLLIDSNTGKTIKDLGAATTGTGGNTAGERETSAISTFQGSFVPGATFQGSGGTTPVLDKNGNLTLEAFKSAISQAPSKGLSREAFLKAFGYLLVDPKGNIASSYGLTEAEKKLITG